MACFAALASAASADNAAPQLPQLPPPQRLMVEYLGEPSGSLLHVIGTTRPRFSFVPHGAWQHPGAGVTMSHYRITVSAEGRAARMLWDSGMVPASSAVSVRCGVDLPRHGYTWTAQWWGGGSGPGGSGQVASPVASATFDIGPNNASDWADSSWIGGQGQTEFRLVFPAAAAVAKLFVASPGGAVVRDLCPPPVRARWHTHPGAASGPPWRWPLSC